MILVMTPRPEPSLILGSKLIFMKKNMGLADRVVRLLIAIALFDLIFNMKPTGMLGILFWIFGVVLFFTSIFARCPLYNILGIHTNSTSKTAPK
jgi:hypothetical protein